MQSFISAVKLFSKNSNQTTSNLVTALCVASRGKKELALTSSLVVVIRRKKAVTLKNVHGALVNTDQAMYVSFEVVITVIIVAQAFFHAEGFTFCIRRKI